MIGPMGMLLAGMAIAEVKKVFCTPRNYLPVFLRLLGVPLVIVLLLWAVHASPLDPGRQVHPDDGLPFLPLPPPVQQSPPWHSSMTWMLLIPVRSMS